MYLLPEFGTRPIHIIKKTDVLAFRSSLAKVTYGKANKHLVSGTHQFDNGTFRYDTKISS